MSTAVFPLEVWQSGTNENSIPANDNALRMEAFGRKVLSKSTNAQPVTPADGDVYIITGAATGAQWSTFAEGDVAIYRDVAPLGTGAGTWQAFAPVSGVVVNVNGSLEHWAGSAWVGAGAASSPSPVVTDSTTNLDATGSNAGNYTRFTNASAKTYTFDDSESYVVGAEYNGRNVGAGDLTVTESGSMTVNAPAGGTLVIPQGGTFTVKIVAINEADLIGVTVAL